MVNGSCILVVVLLAVAVEIGCAASFWSLFGWGNGGNKAKKNNNRRNFNEIDYEEHKDKQREYYSSQEYETYYVKMPPQGYQKDHSHVYDHSDGVDIWELPSIWDGEFSVPSISSQASHEYTPETPEEDRVVKGWDNRWGIRLAIPYIGDFQYVREVGPGDFVPKLGPGKFEYPGPGEVDDPGHKAYKKFHGYYQTEAPPPPVIDLTEYSSLQNYPWYTK